VQLLQLLCGQASMAIENAKLYLQLSATNADLHQAVLERTSENEKLQVAMAAAEKAMRIKSEFLAKSVQQHSGCVAILPLELAADLLIAMCAHLHVPFLQHVPRDSYTDECRAGHLPFAG
jgi:hypothetical protein